MTTAIRWLVVAVLIVHGLIHLLGVAKGFGWAEVGQLREPVSPAAAVLWLLAGALVLTAAALIAAGAPTWWWAVALCAAVGSEAAILTSWDDAKAGTAVNIVLVLAAGYGFVSLGPDSLQAEWKDRVSQALSRVDPAPAVLVEADLSGLPAPLAAYVRRSGAIGEPRVTSFYAEFHGRIRSDPAAPWMTYTGRQVNTYGVRPQRLFLMEATRSGLPVTVLHVLRDGRATMRVKALSLVTLVDAAGPEMDRGETVTLFNDLVVLAPGAIVDAPVRWTSVDDRHVRGVFTNGGQSVAAELTFDAEHDLVDFVSEDRLRASVDGTSFVRQCWSTPLSGHHDVDGHRVLSSGEGRWHPPGPEAAFTYLELQLDLLENNRGVAQPAPVH